MPQRLAEAARLGFCTALVPAGTDPVRIKGLTVVPVATLREAIEAADRASPRLRVV